MNENLKISTGNYFPRAFVYLGYVGILFGIINSFESLLLGLPVVFMGAFVSFNFGTLEIDILKKNSRVYPFLFGLKIGGWTSISEFTEIAVLRKNVSEQTFGGRTNKSVVTQDVFYEICMLDAPHRNKFMLKRFKNKEAAEGELSEFATKLDLKIVTYNPMVSPRTARRR